jgi:hypothetical protein
VFPGLEVFHQAGWGAKVLISNGHFLDTICVQFLFTKLDRFINITVIKRIFFIIIPSSLVVKKDGQPFKKWIYLSGFRMVATLDFLLITVIKRIFFIIKRSSLVVKTRWPNI